MIQTVKSLINVPWQLHGHPDVQRLMLKLATLRSSIVQCIYLCAQPEN
jgi:hypothetical protein